MQASLATELSVDMHVIAIVVLMVVMHASSAEPLEWLSVSMGARIAQCYCTSSVQPSYCLSQKELLTCRTALMVKGSIRVPSSPLQH